MTRVTAGDYCHLISKHSANGWLTSPDAHEYLEITWVFKDTCRYTKMAANIFKCLSVSLNSMQSYSITRKFLGSEALPSPSDGLQKPNYNSLSHQGSICKSSGRPKVRPDLTGPCQHWISSEAVWKFLRTTAIQGTHHLQNLFESKGGNPK